VLGEVKSTANLFPGGLAYELSSRIPTPAPTTSIAKINITEEMGLSPLTDEQSEFSQQTDSKPPATPIHSQASTASSVRSKQKRHRHNRERKRSKTKIKKAQAKSKHKYPSNKN
jgi:hypothetical protein